MFKGKMNIHRNNSTEFRENPPFEIEVYDRLSGRRVGVIHINALDLIVGLSGLQARPCEFELSTDLSKLGLVGENKTLAVPITEKPDNVWKPEGLAVFQANIALNAKQFEVDGWELDVPYTFNNKEFDQKTNTYNAIFRRYVPFDPENPRHADKLIDY